MPKVKSYSAAWLAKNAPGNALFDPLPDSLRSRALALGPARKKPPTGPARTIARRGSEVFVAVGREIRWGDMGYLREDWVERQGSSSARPESEVAVGVRVIKTPLADDIRQLVMSPHGNFLAILTSHTAHICALPDSSHLTSQDPAPLKPKIFTLGPTTHVTSRSPIASALWHPLGVNASCLVTVTADAIVRLWELAPHDRWSFDAPTSSIDLKKLADATALDQNFSAPVSTTNKGFSPDEFEMEVAAAAFGSKSSGGWDPMTLWVAMREGDVYALCPLLPQRWAPPPSLIPSLSVAIVANVGGIEDDPMVDEADRILAQQQLQWMGEIDAQEPQVIESVVPGDRPVEVYTRPAKPGAVPRLQGPFELQADPDTSDELDSSVTDILVIGKKAELEHLSDEADEADDDDVEQQQQQEEREGEYEDGDQQGLSVAVVCLLSTTGQVRIYLDTDGVQGQWLPPRSKSRSSRVLADLPPPTLLAFQAIDTMTPAEAADATKDARDDNSSSSSWPVFSADAMSRYSFFVTHHAAITFVSLTSWVFRLESELAGDFEAGTDFRIGLLVKSHSLRERIYAQPPADSGSPLAAAVCLRDPDLGYFLLSATPYEPIALTFEIPDEERFLQDASGPRTGTGTGTGSESLSSVRDRESSIMAPLHFHEPRPVYSAPHVFSESSVLPDLIERLRTSRHKTVVGAEIKLSPLTLQIFTDAHKVLSDETHRLGVAAAEVFRRCEMLQAELQQQVRTVHQVRGKIDTITRSSTGTGTGEEEEEEEPENDNAMYERRLAAAQERQERLAVRLDSLRKMVSKAAVRDLSAKERAFVDEVKTMEASVLGPAAAAAAAAAAASDRDSGSRTTKQLWKRLEEVRRLQGELLVEAQGLSLSGRRPGTGAGEGEGTMPTPTPEIRIPQDVRRNKMQQVQGLLSRESALVDAVTSRLERLQASL